MQLFGLTREDVETAVEVWPENVVAVRLFVALDTQWRVAHCGRTGIDYQTLPFTMRMHQIPRGDWPDVFEAIQVMERAALVEMHKEKKHGK